jgi:hypothetical protein
MAADGSILLWPSPFPPSPRITQPINQSLAHSIAKEYWVEYGHYFYSKYAPKTDTVFAVVLLLLVFSIFGPVAQRSKYQHACTFLITAAVKGWGLREGGTKEVSGSCVGGWVWVEHCLLALFFCFFNCRVGRRRFASVNLPIT